MKFRKFSIYFWVPLIVVACLVLYIGLNVFQGKMLGALVGTTVDPRTALGERPYSISMDRRLFILKGTVVRRAYDAKKGIETPQIKLAVPKAYINVVRTEKEGWFGTNVTSIAILASSQNFKPYRLEYPYVRKDVLDKLNIKLVVPPPSILDRNPDPRFKIFPNDEAKARYKAEMLRRNFTEIRTGIGANADLDEKRRNKRLLYELFRPYRDALHLSNFADARKSISGCVITTGPFPNSIRIDHAPEIFAPVPKGEKRKPTCLQYRDRMHFAIVTYDDKGKLLFTTRCRDHTNGAGNCHTFFYWRQIWNVGVNVSSKYVAHIPSYFQQTITLYESFAAAAKTNP
ncbi:hypothetical protein NBRC116602_04050 [Hyphomicrobiales bacterium 4NK60-0047b]